ncbi:MAG TPA: C-type lectin domain-containing protein [Polyangiaceae bacterium]|nr:C-type lectin domain-containing protein [Polyangiaceae bacterium]
MAKVRGWALAGGVIFLGALAVAGCAGQERGGEESLGESAAALTAVQQRVLGFEAVAQDWSSSAAVSQSSTRSQGAGALSVQANGWTDVTSRALDSLGSIGSEVSIDLRPPSAATWGEVRLILVSPSRGLTWSDLGGKSLVGLPTGAFSKLTFAIPPGVASALSGTYSDLRLHVVVNGPTGSYLMDQLAFAAPLPPGSTTTSTFSIQLPSGSGPRDVFMSTTERLQIDDQVVAGAAAPSELERIANFGTGGLEIGSISDINADVLNGAGPATLRSRAHVRGAVRAAGAITPPPQDPVFVDGGLFPNSPLSSGVTSWEVRFPTTNAGVVYRGPDLTTPFPVKPGAYSSVDIQSRSRIKLESGTYYFDSFNSEPQAEILLDRSQGPIFIYVKNTFRYHGAFVNGGGQPGNVLVGVLGTANVDLQAGFVGTMIAPNAQIDVRRPIVGQHQGAFFGKRIEVFSFSNVLHLPFDWGFLCPAGDTDGDKTNDCIDACDTDPSKVEPQICGCRVSEVDGDLDRAPNCIDECPTDPTKTAAGQCGCANAPRAAGTPCSDGPCGGGVCDGAGNCGASPTSCRPDTGCFYRQLEHTGYWFCPGPKNWETAAALCRARPGRRLAALNTRLEDAFVTAQLTAPAWSGANDRGVEGAWRWSTDLTNDGLKFWQGSAGGSRVKPSFFTDWAAGQPAEAGDCASLVPGSSGWVAQDCNSTQGFICEQTVGGPIDRIDEFPPVNCSLFSGKFCTPSGGDAPNCKPASVALPDSRDATYQQIEDCQAAYESGACKESDPSSCSACAGAAKLPPPGSRCAAFAPEEQGGCAPQNVISAGCSADSDCCTIATSQALPRVDFESGLGAFTYVDDAFRGTAQPGFASGQRVTSGGHPSGALQVSVGGINNTAVTNMSGGFRASVTLATATRVLVSFDYLLSQSPNYEADERSEVLLSVDGVLKGAPLGSQDYVERLVGDGNGGPAITTGWRAFSRNVGMLSAGTHTITIGVFNNQKTAADETTTLLIDNAQVDTKSDDCPSGYLCGPVSSNCTPCDPGEDPGYCDPDCPKLGVLRCGQPLNIAASGSSPARSCASNDAFPDTELCEQVEICSDPVAPGISNPHENNESNLTPEALVPDEVFQGTEDVVTEYAADPPCDSPPCVAGPPAPNKPKHKWCSYEVDGSVVPPQNVPSDDKQGKSGASTVSFTFDPSISMDYDVTPLPFGIPSFKLDASASFLSGVGVKLGSFPHVDISIVDALLGVHADICTANMSDSHLKLFGLLIPLDGILPEPLEAPGGALSCQEKIEKFKVAVGRVKKAYRDAIELRSQFEKRRTSPTPTSFPTDFCEQLLKDVPPGFPAQACGTETAAATINRFITYYERQIEDALKPAKIALENAVLVPKPDPIPLFSADERESQQLLNVTFPLGPIPMKLELEAFVGYGLNGEVRFDLKNPLTIGEDTGGSERLAFAEVVARPFAMAGVSLFVGAGFGVNGFDVSAGVEGAVTLGKVSLENHAGAGLSVQTLPDDRQFPADVAAAADVSAAASKQTLFPTSGAKSYRYSLDYSYGSTIVLKDILKGSIAGRIRIKIAFFSKTFRKVILTFPGFGPETIPLLTGGGTLASFSPDDLPIWGTVKMPLPFTKLAPLPVTQVLTGPEEPVDMTRVGELFFDGECECSADHAECARDASCCNRGTSVCFSDPLAPSKPTCETCRQGHQTCNDQGDCCNPNARCRDDANDNYPFGIKVCTCEPAGGGCTTIANCCTAPEGFVRFCEDDPSTPGNVSICRECRGLDEPCQSNEDCCDPAGDTFATCDTRSNGSKLCTKHQLG